MSIFKQKAACWFGRGPGEIVTIGTLDVAARKSDLCDVRGWGWLSKWQRVKRTCRMGRNKIR